MKLYIKHKTPAGKVYYPLVNGVVIKDCPFKTATEAQKAGTLLLKSIVGGKDGII